MAMQGIEETPLGGRIDEFRRRIHDEFIANGLQRSLFSRRSR